LLAYGMLSDAALPAQEAVAQRQGCLELDNLGAVLTSHGAA
jgi:hypothetical protein